ncbi:MAG: radical SAM protein [Candidatus Omnitrophota bacterium]
MNSKPIPGIDHIYLDKNVARSPLAGHILRTLGGIPVTTVSDKNAFLRTIEKTPLTAGKKKLWLTNFKGPFLKPCPATGTDYLCCGYRILNAQTHCPLDCTYCILQNYLNVPLITVYVNTGNIPREIDALIASQPRRLFRMGTGELTDSLALDRLIRLNEGLIRHVLGTKMILEIKTKTAQVDHLPDIPKKNVLVSWSLNPDPFIRTEEHKTVSLEVRLKAARKALKKGYRLGFHFDPLLMLPGWKERYAELLEKLTSAIPEKEVMWISLGSLRYPASLKKVIEERFPRTKITTAEFVKGLDGKMRYFRPERVGLYRHIYSEIRRRWEDVFVYFCMENRTVWREVMGDAPESNDHLDYLFHESIARRFPDLKLPAPALSLYQQTSS